jgi:type I restriction enzyme, S subunit
MPELATKRSKAGWTTVAFGDVVRKVTDKVAPEESGLERYIAGEHMDTDDLRIRRWGEIGDGYLGPAFHMRFKPGHVLYGSRRTYLRKVAVADFEGITANTTYVMESDDPKVLLPELLPFIMQTEAFNQHSIRESKGSVNPYVNFSDLAWFEFALPPIEEQRRIVDTMANAQMTHEQLRQAIAVGGQMMTAALHRAFPADPLSTAATLLSEHVDQGIIAFKTGPFGTVLSAKEYRESGWPIINPSEMKDGSIVHDGGPCVDDIKAQRLQSYRLQVGDILLARKGDFSKAVLASDAHQGWIAGSDTIRLRIADQQMLPEYLYFCIRSPQAKRMLISHAHGTVMPGLNERILGSVPVQIRNITDQQTVIDVIKKSLNGIEQLRFRLQECRSLYHRLLDRCFSCDGGQA